MNGKLSNPIVYGWAGVILAQSPLQSLTKLSHRTKFGHPSGDDGLTPFDLRYSRRVSTHKFPRVKYASHYYPLKQRARNQTFALSFFAHPKGGTTSNTTQQSF